MQINWFPRLFVFSIILLGISLSTQETFATPFCEMPKNYFVSGKPNISEVNNYEVCVSHVFGEAYIQVQQILEKTKGSDNFQDCANLRRRLANLMSQMNELNRENASLYERLLRLEDDYHNDLMRCQIYTEGIQECMQAAHARYVDIHMRLMTKVIEITQKLGALLAEIGSIEMDLERLNCDGIS